MKPVNIVPEEFGVSRRFGQGWIFFMAALTSLPYFWAYWATPAGFVYTWILPPYAEDSIAYMAWSRQAANGAVLFSLKYSALPHAPFLFHPVFLVCGWLAALTQAQIGVIHLAVKTAGVVLFFLAFFKVLEYFKLNRLQSYAACVLAGVSSGFGALLLDLFGGESFGRHFPMDLWLVDSNTFWSLLWNPLFPYALTLMLLSVYLMDRGTSEPNKACVWWSGVCVGLLALIHPYETAVLVPLLTAIAFFRLKQGALADLARFAAGAAPLVLYVAAMSYFHPILQQHGSISEAKMKSPSLLSYAFGLGFPGLLAMGGLVFHRAALVKRLWPLLVWIFLSLIMSHLPFWFQNKLLFGSHIPVCIVAAASFGLFFPKTLRNSWVQRVLAILALAPLLCYTSVRVVRDCLEIARQNQDGAYRISEGILDGMNYLKKNSRPGEIVFASTATSLKIPSYAGNTVIWGHWAQSVGLKERTLWAHRVFDVDSGLSGPERTREFYAMGIKYVFLDGGMRELYEKRPALWMTAGADKVFENSEVLIFKRAGS